MKKIILISLISLGLLLAGCIPSSEKKETASLPVDVFVKIRNQEVKNAQNSCTRECTRECTAYFATKLEGDNGRK